MKVTGKQTIIKDAEIEISVSNVFNEITKICRKDLCIGTDWFLSDEMSINASEPLVLMQEDEYRGRSSYTIVNVAPTRAQIDYLTAERMMLEILRKY